MYKDLASLEGALMNKNDLVPTPRELYLVELTDNQEVNQGFHI